MKFEKELPENPSFEYLKREARAMKSRHRNHDPEAAALIGHFDISLHGLTSDEIFSRKFSILDAQRVVARRFGLGSWAKLKRYVQHSAVDAKIADPQLCDELKRRQYAFEKLLEQARKQTGQEKKKRLALLDNMGRDTAIFIDPVLDRYGWPGPDIVGPAGVRACWCIVANATYEADLQFRSAELMNKAFICGDTVGPGYVSILDRCLELSMDMTLYGTVFQIALDDEFIAEERVLAPEGLNQRRAIAGLAPHNYFYSETIQRGKEEGWLRKNSEKDRKHKSDVASKGGYVAAAEKYKHFIDSLV